MRLGQGLYGQGVNRRRSRIKYEEKSVDQRSTKELEIRKGIFCDLAELTLVTSFAYRCKG